MSGYNPPPMQRQMVGDLCYLELCTLEGNTYVVTACPRGFFVNASRERDVFCPFPAHHPHTSQTLLDLLSKVSPQFRANWAALLVHAQKNADLFADDPAFLSLPWVSATLISQHLTTHGLMGIGDGDGNGSWLAAPPRPHTFDLNRSEEADLQGYGVARTSFGAIRDWNEEYQCCKELPMKSAQDRIFRARALSKMTYEFKHAAREGAIAVMRGKIPPLNPHDEARFHVYVLNKIFFSFAVDVRQYYSDVGGDRTTYALACHDLKGVRLLNDLDVPDLHTLATVVVDYLGHRIVAQSIVPGILQGDQASSLEYGSVDRGRSLHFNPDMDKLMTGVAKKLFIQPSHIVRNSTPVPANENEAQRLLKEEEAEKAAAEAETEGQKKNRNKFRVADGETVVFHGPVGTKGILGSDGRHYILDVCRLTPRDPNFATAGDVGDSARHTAVFRPELLQNFQAHRKRTMAAQQQQQQRPADGDNSTSGGDSEDNDANGAKTTDSSKAGAEKVSAALTFDINVFTEHKFDLAPEEVKRREARVWQLADFLSKQMLPALGSSLINGRQLGDGESLVHSMHKFGVNVRYLGALANWVRIHGKDERVKSQEATATTAEPQPTAEDEVTQQQADAAAGGGGGGSGGGGGGAAAAGDEAAAAAAAAAPAKAAPAQTTTTKTHQHNSFDTEHADAKFVIVTAEIEMVARAVKTIVGEILRTHRDLLDAPAILFAAMLNLLLAPGNPASSSSASSGTAAAAGNVAAEQPKRRDYTGQGSGGGGGGNSRSRRGHHHQHDSASDEAMPYAPSPVELIARKRVAGIGLNEQSLWDKIRARVREKYRYRTLRYDG